MRPERGVEAAAHFVRACGCCRYSRAFGHRFGLRVAERDRNMATNRYLVLLSAETMKAEAAGAQAERGVNIFEQAGCAFRQVLCSKPAVFIQNTLQSAFNGSTQYLVDSIAPRQ